MRPDFAAGLLKAHWSWLIDEIANFSQQAVVVRQAGSTLLTELPRCARCWPSSGPEVASRVVTALVCKRSVKSSSPGATCTVWSSSSCKQAGSVHHSPQLTRAGSTCGR